MPTVPPDDESSHGHVLIVDDDRATRNFLRVQLEDAGFDVTMADGGERCLELAVSLLPEVIALDLSMSGMDGIETCRRLRAGAATHDIPILFLTGRQADERALLRALDAGANDFVIKDASRHVLAARLRTQVEISRAHHKMRELSLVDEVSGAWSKTYLRSGARSSLKAMTRPRRSSLCCVVADVAGLEGVNRRHGFRGGDEVMRQVASTLIESPRESDVVARLDGARFGILLVDTDLAGARPVMDRMRQAAAVQVKMATISFGVAQLDAVAVDALRVGDPLDAVVEDLVKRAVVAARKAEREGAGCVVVDDGVADEIVDEDSAPDSEPTRPHRPHEMGASSADAVGRPSEPTGIDIDIDIDVDDIEDDDIEQVEVAELMEVEDAIAEAEDIDEPEPSAPTNPAAELMEVEDIAEGEDIAEAEDVDEESDPGSCPTTELPGDDEPGDSSHLSDLPSEPCGDEPPLT